ncbi:hypothetical protein J3D55_003741 [Chryseobacterium ginsenosidimutans]|nr:hypothetical protein [Chryseobacterium ginsenosidimutans]
MFIFNFKMGFLRQAQDDMPIPIDVISFENNYTIILSSPNLYLHS